MLFFGHIGITLAVELGLKRLYSDRPTEAASASDSQTISVTAIDNKPPQSSVQGFSGHIRHIVRRMDLRVLIVGSMLPDIIDKPLGQVFFIETFMSGRIFAHTLLLLIVISLLGVYLYRRRGMIWLVVLSFGSALHLLEDSMWNGFARTLFWPFMGLTFDRLDLDYWFEGLWYRFLHVPAVYVPEWIGIAIFTGFVTFLIYRKKVNRFFKTGLVL